MDNISMDEDEETRILLEKEFDDYYEDHVHKSAGPVVFVSKMLGMIPVIWTEDESESECKSYFNLYTFVIFIGNKFRVTYTLIIYTAQFIYSTRDVNITIALCKVEQ
jgi:hypothetical protein